MRTTYPQSESLPFAESMRARHKSRHAEPRFATRPNPRKALGIEPVRIPTSASYRRDVLREARALGVVR